MATSSAGALLTGVEWNSSPVTFHDSTGRNIRLTEDNRVATRVSNIGAATVVFTAETLSVGQLFKVTVTRCGNEDWMGGLDIGFTGEDPADSSLTRRSKLAWQEQDKDVLCTSSTSFHCKDKELCELGFNTSNLQADQWLGLLLTSEGECHWFLDGEWRGSVPVRDFPLDQPMWGVVNVYGRCEQVEAEIYTVSTYPPGSESRLVEMGLMLLLPITPVPRAKPSLVHKLFGVQPDSAFQRRSNQQLIQAQSVIQQLQRALAQAHKKEHPVPENPILFTQQVAQLNERLMHAEAEIKRLTHANQQLIQAKQQLIQSKQQLTQSNRQLQRTNAENQQLVVTLRDRIDVLQRRVSSAPSNAQEVEFWQVSPDQVSVREDQILGQGAWGYVAKGTFRGTTVAVKQIHGQILLQTTVDRIRREISTMAQIRHPNLVLFIAAVLSQKTGPMIVTELLDISLREAYQTNRVGPNKRRIFEDVSSALVYLHEQREPVIHRDVSSANVLLHALPNNSWLAKLSDFGSANLVRDATTLGEGAILYTAPEAFPQGPYSPQPRPQQSTKIDVYSFGVLACEVVTRTFPKSEVFHELLFSVSRVWGSLHPLIVSCVSHSPQDRPSMDTVLQQLKRINYEP